MTDRLGKRGGELECDWPMVAADAGQDPPPLDSRSQAVRHDCEVRDPSCAAIREEGRLRGIIHDTHIVSDTKVLQCSSHRIGGMSTPGSTIRIKIPEQNEINRLLDGTESLVKQKHGTAITWRYVDGGYKNIPLSTTSSQKFNPSNLQSTYLQVRSSSSLQVSGDQEAGASPPVVLVRRGLPSQ